MDHDIERDVNDGIESIDTDLESGGGGFVAGVVLGALVGAGIALLMAPEPGRKARKKLGRRVRSFSDRAAEEFDDRTRDPRRRLRRDMSRRRKRLERRFRDAVSDRF